MVFGKGLQYPTQEGTTQEGQGRDVQRTRIQCRKILWGFGC